MRDTPSLKQLIVPGLFVLELFITQYQRQQEETPLWRVQGEVMGTTYTVQVVAAQAPSAEGIHAALEAVNAEMSTYLKSAQLSQLNAHKSGEPFEISPALYELLKSSQALSALSGGAFDVTVGPLVNAWGFGPEGRVTTPSPAQVQALKAHVGSDKFKLSEPSQPGGSHSLTKLDPELYIDLSANAKGYGVDQAAAYLSAQGFDRYWVEVGGEVKARGLNAEGRAWRAGIERPAGEGRRAVFMVLPLQDRSIATSGDYRNRYLDERGVMRSHTIDPRTGEPVTHQLASVSVVLKDNAMADAWATALNVLGPEEGLKLANAQSIPALFLVRAEGALQGDLNAPLKALVSEPMSAYLLEVGASLPE